MLQDNFFSEQQFFKYYSKLEETVYIESFCLKDSKHNTMELLKINTHIFKENIYISHTYASLEQLNYSVALIIWEQHLRIQPSLGHLAGLPTQCLNLQYLVAQLILRRQLCCTLPNPFKVQQSILNTFLYHIMCPYWIIHNSASNSFSRGYIWNRNISSNRCVSQKRHIPNQNSYKNSI